MSKRVTAHRPSALDRDQDTYISTVKFINVKQVEKQAELLNLLTHIIKEYSTTKSILVQAKTSANTIEYRVTKRRAAITMAKKVQAAFKHHHPVVDITEPRNRTFCNVTVTFNP